MAGVYIPNLRGMCSSRLRGRCRRAQKNVGGGGGERGLVRRKKPAPAVSTEVVHHRVVAPSAGDRDGGKNPNTKELVLQLQRDD